MITGTVLVFIALAAAIALLLWFIFSLTRRPEATDAWRIAGTSRLSPAALHFYLAYIGRHSTFRRVGAVAAVVLSGLWTWRTSQSLMLWGTDQNAARGADCDPVTGWCAWGSPAGDGSIAGVAVFAAVLGAIVGGLLAETYRLRAPQGPRLASLDARPPRPLPRPTHSAWLVTALALGLAVVMWAVTGGPALLLGLLPGLLAVGLAEAIQAALAGRRRPVLTDEAMAADRNLRQAVSRSVTWLELGAAILCLGWAAMSASAWLASRADGLGNAARLSVTAAFLGVFGFLAVVPALVCLYRSALIKGRRATKAGS